MPARATGSPARRFSTPRSRRTCPDSGEELIDRLLAALDAGEDAGGDTKGHRSATVVIMGTELYPLWDLRIDDADEPLAHLHERKRTFAEELVPEVETLPTRTDPLGGSTTRATKAPSESPAAPPTLRKCSRDRGRFPGSPG